VHLRVDPDPGVARPPAGADARGAAKLGAELPDGYILQLGRSVVVAERAFNRLAGFGPADDRLPDFLRKETFLPGGNVWDVPDEDLDNMFS
jgi:aldehyde:ferredoxin oxidoreductase